MNKKLYELFLMMGYFEAPTDSGGGIADIDLNEDDDENEEEDGDKEFDEGEDGDEESEESDESGSDDESEDENDEEGNEDDEESEEEDEDSDTPVGDIKAIKAKYKDFFKEFPGVKAALYRDQQYSEHFGSPKDAEDTVKKASILDQVNEDLFTSHDPSNLLESLAKDKNALENVAFEFMRWTMKNNKDLYLELAALPLKQVLRNAWREGNGDKSNLGRAAQFIHKFFFNDTEIGNKVKIEDGKSTSSNGDNKAKEAYERRLTQLEEREYNSFKDSVEQSYVRRMTSHVQESLDKDDRLNDWMKSTIVEKIIIEIRNQLNTDSRYMNHVGSLWKQAKTAGFSNDFKSRILNTALARAKSLVPDVRKKLVAEALGKKAKKEKDTDGKVRKFKKVERTESREKTPKTNKTDADILREA